MPTFSGSRRFLQLRTISGVVLFAYVLTHMLNHSLGLASLQAMDEWRWVLSWQFAGGWIIILAAALAHSAHALWSLYDRRVMRMPSWQLMQLVLGLSIPFLLVDHVLGTRAVAELYGVNPNYAMVQLTYWRLAPHLGVLQSIVMIVAWVHGCMGLHFWLRLRPWYRVAAPGLFTLAVLVPTLSLLGFVVSGRALLVETEDPAVISLIIANARVPGTQAAAFVSETGLMFRYGFAALIVLTLAARIIRNLLLVAVRHLYPDLRRRPCRDAAAGRQHPGDEPRLCRSPCLRLRRRGGVRPAGSASRPGGSICRRRLPPNGRC